MARKPPALARELLRNFPKRRARNARRRRKGPKGAGLTNGNSPVETPLSRRPEDAENELRRDVREGLARDATLDHAGEKA
jgi:hypothetical protein